MPARSDRAEKSYSLLLKALTLPITLFLVVHFMAAAGHGSQGALLFVAHDDYPPINFLENGTPKGVCVDIVDALGKTLGQKTVVRLMKREKAQKMVQTGDADALGLMTVTEEKKLLYDFTEPVMQFEYSLFVRKENSRILTLKDLEGKTVGVAAGGYSQQTLAREPRIRLVVFANYAQGLHQLAQGKVEAFAGDEWVTLYHLQQEGIGNVRSLPPFAAREASFAVKKGNRLLLRELNAAVAQLKSTGTINRIVQQWSGEQMVVMTRERLTHFLVIGVCAGAVVLSIILSLWVVSLKKESRNRRRAEELHATSEERYRTLVERAPDAIVVYDIDLDRIVDANGTAVTLFGCSREELLEGGPQRFYTAQQPDGLILKESLTLSQERVLSGEEVLLERSVVNAQGKHLTCEVRLVKLPSADDTRLIRASFIDVTERKAAERNHRLSEEKYRGIFEHAPVGIFQTGFAGTIIEVNPALANMFGYETPEQMMAGPWDATGYFVHAEQRGAILAKAQASSSFVSDEVEYRRRDGTSFTGTLYIRAVRAPDGAPRYFEGFIEDITSRKMALAELRKLSQAVEQSPVSILITDAKGTIEFANPKFSQVTGYDLEELRGKNPRLLKSGHTPQSVYEELWSTIRAGKVWEGELFNKKKNGDLFWEHAAISPIRNDDGAITNFMAVKEDITEQKSVKEQLFQAQKMEAIGQLAGGVAHDFNNILTVIIGYANLIAIGKELSARDHEAAQQIIMASERASQLTRGLLTLSRKQVMTPQRVNLNEIIRHLQKVLMRIIGEDIQVNFIAGVGSLPVKVDSGQIEQVIINLATNARDAMPGGGILTMETGYEEVSAPWDEVQGSTEPGRFATITVSDTGTGMDEGTRSRIFEPFFTTKEVGKGTGLGMAIVYGIVKQHNGYINVYSEVGYGTTFRIYLPIDATAQAAGEEPPSPTMPRRGTETLLVVEDDVNVRKLEVMVLTEFGYQVLAAEDGLEAVEQFTLHRDKIDLILMDMIMPRKNGKEAYEEISRLQPDVKVLFASGYTADFIKNRGLSEEGIDLIMKPVQPMELLRKVREKLDA